MGILDLIFHKHEWVRFTQYPQWKGDGFMYHEWRCIICQKERIERENISQKDYVNATFHPEFKKKFKKGLPIEFEDMLRFSKKQVSK